MDEFDLWVQEKMYDMYAAMGLPSFEGATSTHLQSVIASHLWNMEYGGGDLSAAQYNAYYDYSATQADKITAAGQNESPQGVIQYWELMETYLEPISPRTAAAAGAGVEAAEAIAEGPMGKKKGRFPWWLIALPVALYIWRK